MVTAGAAAADANQLLRTAIPALWAAGIETPRVDAEILLATVCGLRRGDLVRTLMLGRNPLAEPEQVAAFEALITRRVSREPLQHLTGVAPFRHLDLHVGPGVFVPRPETEVVAQVAIDEARSVVDALGAALVVDLCTGSAAIALAIASEVPGTVVHAVELDATAASWAQRNIAEHGAVVRLVRGDARTALRELDGRCDVVVSNPPYVPSDAIPRDREVAEHDPPVALYGLGHDGLEVPRGVTVAAGRLLRPGGLYVMEHAEVQGSAAREMVAETGFFAAGETRDDLTGRPRLVVARRGEVKIVEDSDA
jgi:release factor glutamine methyltransferase